MRPGKEAPCFLETALEDSNSLHIILSPFIPLTSMSTSPKSVSLAKFIMALLLVIMV